MMYIICSESFIGMKIIGFFTSQNLTRLEHCRTECQGRHNHLDWFHILSSRQSNSNNHSCKNIVQKPYSHPLLEEYLCLSVFNFLKKTNKQIRMCHSLKRSIEQSVFVSIFHSFQQN